MPRGDELDIRRTEATRTHEEEARSLLSRSSFDDDGLGRESQPLAQLEGISVPELPLSDPDPSENIQSGSALTPRTPNRVRFDLDDESDGDSGGASRIEDGRQQAWLNEEDYMDDGADQPRRSSGSIQQVPLLTNIEAPSVTVATDFFPEDHLESARPKSGLRNAFMNMANSIIGAGIIGQPYAFRQAGMTMGIILLIGLTCTVDWTIRLIVVNSKLSGADSFQSTVEFCFGRTGLIAISIAQWAFAFGGMIAFNIIVGDTIPHVLSAILPSLKDMPFLWLLTDRRAIIVIFVLGISYPLSLYRDIAKVRKYSLSFHRIRR